MTAPTIIPRIGANITEAQFQDQIVHVAHLYGWKVAHFRTAQNGRGQYRTAVAYDGKGFPDLVMVHADRGRVVFAELKSERGVLSKEQGEWACALDEAIFNAECDNCTLSGGLSAMRCDVWRPSDWPHIVDLLTFGKAKAVT